MTIASRMALTPSVQLGIRQARRAVGRNPHASRERTGRQADLDERSG